MKSKISAAARSEILALLQRQMYVSADQAAEVLEKYGVSGDDETLQKRYRKRLCQQLMASIRDEDGHRQVLALCDTKGGAEYIIIDCCNDPVKLEKIWSRLNGQMTGLDNSTTKVEGRLKLLGDISRQMGEEPDLWKKRSSASQTDFT